MKKKIIRIIVFVLIVLWAIAVFSMSNQQGEESSGLSRKVTSILFKSEEMVEKVEPIIRKLAHFSEYALGGMLFIILFMTYDWNNKKRVLISICIGIWYAALDEFHQVFVPNRHGCIKDVLIDSLGIVTGVFFVILIYIIYKKIVERRKAND